MIEPLMSPGIRVITMLTQITTRITVMVILTHLFLSKSRC